MWAQILRAGPSLMFMVDIRCSSFSSSRACPSISCDRNWEASSSQPANRRTKIKEKAVGEGRGFGIEEKVYILTL